MDQRTMAEAVVTETTAKAPDPDHEQEEQNCLLSVWNFKPVMILRLVLLPLGLYLFDMITDLMLAVQYYYSADSTWFGLTLGFVLGPSIIINFLSLYMLGFGNSTTMKGLKWLLAVLQLSVVSGYLHILYLLVRGKDVQAHDEATLSTIVHLFEAMLESVPQLCLQLYIIILTGEQVSVLKVITMVASLLAAVKAVVTSLYYEIDEADRTCSCGFVTRLILLTVWKVVELSVRVLAIGLFASAFKPWIVLPIGAHWLLMTVTYICIEGEFSCMISALVMAADTFSMTRSMDHNWLFALNRVLTLLGNIIMTAVWYTLKAGQDRYDVPALVVVIVGSVVSAVFGFIEMGCRVGLRT